MNDGTDEIRMPAGTHLAAASVALEHVPVEDDGALELADERSHDHAADEADPRHGVSLLFVIANRREESAPFPAGLPG